MAKKAEAPVDPDLLGLMCKHVQQLTERLDNAKPVLEAQQGGMITADLARFFVLSKQLKDGIEALEKSLNPFHTRFKEVVIPERLELEGLSTVPLKGVGRVTVSMNVRASIKAEAKPDAFAWLRKNDYDIIQETVNAATLSALAKSVAEEGKELPEALFNVLIVPNTSFTRTK